MRKRTTQCQALEHEQDDSFKSLVEDYENLSGKAKELEQISSKSNKFIALLRDLQMRSESFREYIQTSTTNLESKVKEKLDQRESRRLVAVSGTVPVLYNIQI